MDAKELIALTDSKLKALLADTVYILIALHEKKHTPAAAQEAIAKFLSSMSLCSTHLAPMIAQLGNIPAQHEAVDITSEEEPDKYCVQHEKFYRACRLLMLDSLKK